MMRPKSHGRSSSRRYAFGLVKGMDWICIHDASASISNLIVYSYDYLAHSYYIHEGLDD